MRKKICFFLSFLMVLEVSCQIDVEFGKIFDNEKREIPIDIIGKDETGYYLLYAEGKYGEGDDIYLRKFDSLLTPTNLRVNLKVKERGFEFNSVGIVKIGDKIIHLFSLKSDEEQRYYHQSIDINNFSVTDKKLITNNQLSNPMVSEYVKDFYISKKENSIIVFLVAEDKMSGYFQLKKQTFNLDFNKQSEVIFKKPFNGNLLDYFRILRSANDQFFLQTKEYDKRKSIVSEEKKKYEHRLYSLNSPESKLIYSIRPEEYHMRYIDINIENENEAIVTSLISKRDMYSMSGIYMSNVDLKSGRKIYEKYNALSIDFFTSLVEEGKKKEKLKKKYQEGKVENTNYTFKNFIPLNNGATLVLAEQTWSMTQSYATTYYHYNIALIKLDNKGSIVWETKIGKKNRKGNTSIYSSFLPILRENKLLMLYNGNTDNLYHRFGEVKNAFTSRNRAFICTEVDLVSGDYKRSVVIDESQLEGITIRPSLYDWMDDDTLYMFGQDIDDLKKQRFFKLKLE